MSLSQQPVVVYPNTVAGQPPPSSHSNGSFRTVFVVLAVIVVFSAIACFLGRLCNRKIHGHHPKAKQNQANFRPKENRPRERDPEFRFEGRPKEKDIEFGFDNRIPTAKPAGNGEMKAYKPHGNGEIYGENKAAYDGELRASA